MSTIAWPDMSHYEIDLIDRTHGVSRRKEFFDIVNLLPNVSHGGPWLCGGAIRRLIQHGENTSDYDFFFRDEQQISAFTEAMKQRGGIIKRQTKSNTTWALGQQEIQQITLMTYSSIESVLNSFDFTICQFGWDGTHIVAGPYALWDLGRKRLALHSLTYGVSTLRRLMKYSKQGFTVCSGVLADILIRTVNEPGTINHGVVSLD